MKLLVLIFISIFSTVFSADEERIREHFQRRFQESLAQQDPTHPLRKQVLPLSEKIFAAGDIQHLILMEDLTFVVDKHVDITAVSQLTATETAGLRQRYLASAQTASAAALKRVEAALGDDGVARLRSIEEQDRANQGMYAIDDLLDRLSIIDGFAMRRKAIFEEISEANKVTSEAAWLEATQQRQLAIAVVEKAMDTPTNVHLALSTMSRSVLASERLLERFELTQELEELTQDLSKEKRETLAVLQDKIFTHFDAETKNQDAILVAEEELRKAEEAVEALWTSADTNLIQLDEAIEALHEAVENADDDADIEVPPKKDADF
jgi:hypothetical protein